MLFPLWNKKTRVLDIVPRMRPWSKVFPHETQYLGISFGTLGRWYRFFPWVVLKWDRSIY
jgi:hypothetical protein